MVVAPFFGIKSLISLPAFFVYEDNRPVKYLKIIGAATILLCVSGAVCYGAFCGVYYCSEQAAAAAPTYTISVFDGSGDLIREYDEVLNVEEGSANVTFETENGDRTTIYFSTGTVIVTEEKG